MVIYKITNLLNGKIYIGQTTRSLEERYKNHLYMATRPEKTSHLHLAMQQDGVENFCVEEIDTASSQEELDEKEQFWIEKLNTCDVNVGYNITSGGSGVRGISAWNKDLTKEDDARLIQSQQTKDKRAISLSKAHAEGKFNYEEMFTPEVRAKMSEKAKQRPHPPTTEGRLGYTNGHDYKTLKLEDIPTYEAMGWWHGRPEKYKHREPPNKGITGVNTSSKKGKYCIHYPGLPNLKNVYIDPSLYEFYYTQGWCRGSRKLKDCTQ